MSGGNKREQYNTRERVISDDLNREQKFIAFDRAQMRRHMANDIPKMSFDYGSARDLTSLPAQIDAPLRADIFEGLLVLPVLGTWSLYVSPGVVGMHDPDGETGSSDPTPANVDDSSYKMVVDQGISAIGQLVIVPNGAAFTRIDTIECQRLEVVLEQDNRDIYNPATRTFTPALVDKVVEGRLTYRVRQGAPGAGMPAPVQGWLPLAIARVPITAASCDDCTFWDVRPVVRDRPFSPYRDFSGINASQLGNHLLHADPFTVGGKTKIGGVSDGEAFPGVMGGGHLQQGTPTADAVFDAQDVVNQEPGFALAAYQIWYLWHVFPYGLPRWVRYITTPTSSGVRFPFGPKGIPVASETGPSGLTHGLLLGSTITVPVSTELAVACDVGVCVGAFGSTAAGVPGAAIVDGDWTWLGKGCLITGIAPTAGAGSLVSNTWTLVAGAHFPTNARALRIVVGCGVIGTANKGANYSMRVFVRRPGSSDELASYVYQEVGGVSLGDTGTVAFFREFEIPRPPPNALYGTANLEFTVEWYFAGTALTKSGEFAAVTGWRLSR